MAHAENSIPPPTDASTISTVNGRWNGGWYPRRRGILQHLENGTVSLLDVAVHDVLCLWADHQTGVCFASAEKIKALCPAQFSYKSIQRSLEKLERLDWIKRWMTRGKRGNYPVLVCRFFVRDTSMTWWSTSADRTTDWRNVQFDPVHDPSFNRPAGVHSGVHEVATEVSGVLEVREKNKTENQQTRPFVVAEGEPKNPKAISHEFSESQNQPSPERAFDQACRRYRRIVGKSFGTWSSLGYRQKEWSGLVAREGEQTVIDAVELCAKEKADFLRDSKFPAAFFLKNAADWIRESKTEAENAATANGGDSRSLSDEFEEDYARLLRTFPELAKKTPRKHSLVA